MLSSNLPRANLDRRGNWNEFSQTIGVSPVTTTQTRTPNGVNEYLSIDPDGPSGLQLPVNLSHDASGNLTLDPTARNLGDGPGGVPDPSGQVYEYDEENRLTAVRRASDNALLLSISYDAVGRRISSADYLAAGDPCGGPPALTRHVYAALETLEEHLSCDGGTNHALVREFVWGDRFPQPVALVTHGGTGGFGGASVPAGESVYHYLHDVLGSVVALTNASGQVVERYTYDPYGKTVIEATNPTTGLPTARLNASAFGNPFAWTGQRYDAGVRLYHFLFRGYSPHLGRWLHRDPLDYVDGASLYQYLTSRPLWARDTFGLQTPPATPPLTPEESKELIDAIRRIDKMIEEAEKDKAWARVEELRVQRAKLLAKAGLLSAILLGIIGDDAQAMAAFTRPGSACRDWYAAGLRADHQTMEEKQDECYLELLEAGHYHAALLFHKNASKIAAKVAEKKKQMEEAERKAQEDKEKKKDDGKKDCPNKKTAGESKKQASSAEFVGGFSSFCAFREAF